MSLLGFDVEPGTIDGRCQHVADGERCTEPAYAHVVFSHTTWENTTFCELHYYRARETSAWWSWHTYSPDCAAERSKFCSVENRCVMPGACRHAGAH